MKFIEELCIAYSRNSSVYGYNIRQLLSIATFYIVPMVNPDGVDLVNDKLNFNSNEYTYARYISKRYSDIPFPNGWKANINGVDLKNYQPFCKVL